MKLGDLVGLLSLGSLIGIGTAFDLRTKRIPVLLLVLGGLGVCVGAALPGTLPLQTRLIGMIPGVLLLLIGLLWHMIGTGDSVLVMLAGFSLGFRGLSFFLMVSLLCLLPVALLLLVFRKAGRKDTMPFYPFAAMGLMISLLLGVVP
ncbi:MAG: hypothetical protein J6Y67_04410 [Lachnospiraceae bacterium]|nr:hypothetical protein [Lachnospiraceae bacterium]